MTVRPFDLSPLFRSSIGFDRLGRLLETSLAVDEQAISYPPYNIEKLDGDRYRLTMAVAGFGEGDLEIVVRDQQLQVKGKAKPEAEGVQVLHRGIAGRAFERRFHLADHMVVTEARLENGLLHIAFERRVPEALKPRQIPIAVNPTAHQAPTIEAQAA